GVASTDAAPLLRGAASVNPQLYRARLARLDAYLEESDPGTPYREAVLSVRRQLDAARRGDAPARQERGREGKLPGHSPPLSLSLSPPLPAGQPAVLIFFMPGQETTDLSLVIADALQRRYGSRLAIVPLAMFADAALGVNDRDRLKLSVPVYDGAAAGVAYGVETFPRFVVIDGGGGI